MEPVSTITAIASGLSWVAPKIAGWLGGDDAEEKAKKVVGVAQSLTGQSDPQSAVDAIRQDPEQARKFEEAMGELELEMERERTKQLTQINQTMRTEYKESGWKSGWRPYFGYMFATAYGVLFFGIIALIGFAMRESVGAAVELTGAIGGMISSFTPLLGIGLAVLGIQIRERGKDKHLAAGAKPPEGALDKIIKAFGKG